MVETDPVGLVHGLVGAVAGFSTSARRFAESGHNVEACTPAPTSCRTPPNERQRRSLTMKYMILIHSNPNVWQNLPKEESDRVLGEHYRIINELKETGEMVRVEGLGWDQTFVQFQNGVPAVTDGPYSEVKELLAGLFQIDVENLDRAIELAGPLSEYGWVEIRPVMEDAGDPDVTG
jgi:hypothetical protein